MGRRGARLQQSRRSTREAKRLRARRKKATTPAPPGRACSGPLRGGEPPRRAYWRNQAARPCAQGLGRENAENTVRIWSEGKGRRETGKLGKERADGGSICELKDRRKEEGGSGREQQSDSQQH